MTGSALRDPSWRLGDIARSVVGEAGQFFISQTWAIQNIEPNGSPRFGNIVPGVFTPVLAKHSISS